MVLDLSNSRVDHHEDSETLALGIQDNLLEISCEQEALAENLVFFNFNVISPSFGGILK